jgi:hypothetical protein
LNFRSGPHSIHWCRWDLVPTHDRSEVDLAVAVRIATFDPDRTQHVVGFPPIQVPARVRDQLRDVNLAVIEATIPISQVQVGVVGRHRVEIVAVAECVLVHGIAAVLSDKQADIVEFLRVWFGPLQFHPEGDADVRTGLARQLDAVALALPHDLDST